MLYLRHYSNLEEYKNDTDLVYPNVCFIEDIEQIIINSSFDESNYYEGFNEENTLLLPSELQSGEYILYYEDKDGKILDNFSKITNIYI